MMEIALFTAEERAQLLSNGRASEQHGEADIFKLFTPDAGCTWLITEADLDDPDRLFGLCDLGMGYPELGYVSLTELLQARGPLGLPIERDRHFIARKTLIEYADEARQKGRIVA